jgi:hypothetical protein
MPNGDSAAMVGRIPDLPLVGGQQTLVVWQELARMRSLLPVFQFLAVAATGLVELAAVTLGGAARTRVAGEESREGVAGRRGRAAVDQAGNGQLGADPGGGQPGHLHDPLAASEPSPDRVAELDRRGRLKARLGPMRGLKQDVAPG